MGENHISFNDPTPQSLSAPAHKSFYHIHIRCLNGVGQIVLSSLFGIDLLHTALDWLHRWLQRNEEVGNSSLYFNKLVDLTTVYQVSIPPSP